MEWIGKLLLIQHLCLQGLTSSGTMRRLVTISFQTVATNNISILLSFGFLFGRFWNYCVKITFLFQLIISCCSQLETVGTMGETLRVKAGEDAIKRVQQGFDKVAKEKQMNGSVILLIISVDRPSCWMWVGLFGWRVTQSWPGRRTVSQHRLHTVLRDALLRNMLGFGICLVLHPAHGWYKNLI